MAEDGYVIGDLDEILFASLGSGLDNTFFPLEDMRTATAQTYRVSLETLKSIYGTAGDSGAGVPEFDTIAALEATTSGVTTATRVYVKSRTAIPANKHGDGTSGFWYMAADDTSYDSSYDDDIVHVVDASGRIWAREFTVITHGMAGVTVEADWRDAEDGTDYKTELQKLIDLWADPTGVDRDDTRNGATPGTVWNEFKGWVKRPAWDQWARPMVLGERGGYMRTSVALYFDTYSKVTQEEFGSHWHPGALICKARILLDNTSSGPVAECRFRSYTLKEPVVILTRHAPYRDTASTYTVNWYRRTDSATVTADRYPQIPWPANNRARTYSGGMTIYEYDLIKHTHTSGPTSGSTWLYQAAASDVTVSTAPTHTTAGGTTDNQTCIGEYKTINDHGYEELLAAELDIGVLVSVSFRNKSAPIYLCGGDCAVGVMIKPNATLSGVFGWSSISVGHCPGSKIQVCMMNNYDGATWGWCNENDIYCNDFNLAVPSTATAGTDASRIGVMICSNPSATRYGSNANRFHHINVEGADRTGNCWLVQACLLNDSQNNTVHVRNDDNVDSYSFVIGQNLDSTYDPEGNTLRCLRPGKIISGGSYNNFVIEKGDVRERQSFFVDFARDHVCQGGGGTAADRRAFFKDAWEIYSLSGVLANGMRVDTSASSGQYANIYDPGLDAWNFSGPSGSQYWPAIVFDVEKVQASTTDREWLNCEVQVNYARGAVGGRVRLFNLKPSGGLIAPSTYPTTGSQPNMFIPDGGSITSSLVASYYQTTNNDTRYAYKFGVPSNVRRLAISPTGLSIRSINVHFVGSKRVQIVRPPWPMPLLKVPEMGRYTYGQHVTLSSGVVKTLSPSGTRALADKDIVLYGVKALYADATAYDEGDMVYEGSATSATVSVRISSGTSSGASTAADTGQWTQLTTSSVYVVVPADWT